jgi:hypothetical protein
MLRATFEQEVKTIVPVGLQHASAAVRVTAGERIARSPG